MQPNRLYAPQVTDSKIARYGIPVAAALGGAIGATWLVLWILGVPQRLVGTPTITMKSNMAVAQVLAAIGLLCGARPSAQIWRRLVAFLCAIVVLTIGSLTIAEYLFSLDLHIDDLLFVEPPGATGVLSPNRMGPPGALSLTLIGAALLVLALRRRRAVPYLGVAVCVIALIPAIGYVYGVSSFYEAPNFTTIAWSSALGLMALAIGLIVAVKETGPVAILLRDDAGGVLLRRLLPVTIVAPIVLGYMRTVGERAGLYGAHTGRALLVLSFIILFSALLVMSAVRLSRSARAQNVLYQALQESERRFRLIFDRAGVGVVEVDAEDRFIAANDRACEILGYSRPELLRLTVDELTAPEDRSRSHDLNAQLHSGQFERFENEKRYLRRDGTPLWVRVVVSAVRSDNGRHLGAITTVEDISERKQAEEALRLIDERFQFVVRATNDAIWDWDLNTNALWWGGGLSRVFGHETSDGGRTIDWWYQQVHPDDRDRVVSGIHRAIEGGETLWRDEYRYLRADGAYADVLDRGFVIRDPSGRPTRILGAVQDITQQKRAHDALREREAALRESEERFRALVNASSDVVYVVSPDWKVMRHLDGRGFIFDTPQPNQDWLEKYVPPEDHDIVLHATQDAIRRKALYELEHRVRRVDGTIGWTLSRAVPLLDDKGEIAAWFGAASDITERKMAQQALLQSRDRLMTLIKSAPVGLAMLDRRMRYVQVSNQWLKHVGLTQANVVGMSHYDQFPNLPDHFREAHHRGLAGETVSGEDQWTTAAGETRIMRWGVHPWGDSGVETGGVILFSEDVTEHKQAQEALIRSEKLASVGRMAATVAHEINNPLAMIVNSVFIASMDPNLSEQSRKSLEAAEKELERVAHLTRQTLGFYRENTAPSDVDLGALVSDVVELYKPKFMHRDIAVQSECSPGLTVHAISGEIRQVVSNLISNAIDASPRNGRFRLRTRRVHTPAGSFVRLTVADTGEGIAPENLARIFEPFFTTKKAVGTGLGLWVSSEIVRRHNGAVRVRSRQGLGTVFFVLLPEASSPIDVNHKREDNAWVRAS